MPNKRENNKFERLLPKIHYQSNDVNSHSELIYTWRQFNEISSQKSIIITIYKFTNKIKMFPNRVIQYLV